MKKSWFFAGLIVLAAVLLVLPVGVQAEMYVEGYLGGVMANSESITFQNDLPENTQTQAWRFPGRFDGPFVIGGGRLGTWFVKEGFPGFNYPDWMKYLGFYLDFSYHRLVMRKQDGSVSGFDDATPFLSRGQFFSEGAAVTLAFMFAGRYGFFPDSEVPFGRLQPYMGVGPAILFTSQRLSFKEIPFGAGTYQIDTNSQTSTNIALAVDAGIRYLALKNVSLDVCFNYRYAQPSYTFDFTDSNTVPGGIQHSVSYSQPLNLFSIKVGAAYHF